MDEDEPTYESVREAIEGALIRDGQLDGDECRRLSDVAAAAAWNEMRWRDWSNDPLGGFVLDKIKGEVGVIAGPAILGTNDDLNAGPAKLPKGMDADKALAKLALEVEPHPFRAMVTTGGLCARCGADRAGGRHTDEPDHAATS